MPVRRKASPTNGQRRQQVGADEAEVLRPQDGVQAGSGSELLQHVSDVELDGLDRNHEVRGNVGIALARGQHFEDLRLPSGERDRAVSLVARRWGEASGGCVAHRFRNLRAGGRLSEDAANAQAVQLAAVGHVVVAGHRQKSDVGLLRADRARHVYPAAVWQAQIEDEDVRPLLPHETQAGLHVSRDAHHVDVVERTQECRGTLPNHRVIVHDDHAYGVSWTLHHHFSPGGLGP